MGLALRALTPKAVISRTERMEVIMKVSECRTREVEIVDPDTTLQNTARIMAEIDAGILPVSDGERLIGIITDRDIAVRGVALGRSPDTRVGAVRSKEVLYCCEDQDVEDGLVNMGRWEERRVGKEGVSTGRDGVMG